MAFWNNNNNNNNNHDDDDDGDGEVQSLELLYEAHLRDGGTEAWMGWWVDGDVNGLGKNEMLEAKKKTRNSNMGGGKGRIVGLKL